VGRRDTLAALDRLARAEEAARSQEFLAPVGGFTGWGVFVTPDLKAARLVREATLAERARYLRLWPRLRVILVSQDGPLWTAVPTTAVGPLVDVHLLGGGQPFETVVARWDGALLLGERVDAARGPVARALRDALADSRPLPEVATLTPWERAAYREAQEAAQEAARAVAAVAAGERARVAARASRGRVDRLRTAVTRAGGRYLGAREEGSRVVVTYEIEGERHQSVVAADTLRVEAAGICLSGGDREFDLQSLVGVVGEGVRRDLIVRVGDNHLRSR
jgi:hypothetical protein